MTFDINWPHGHVTRDGRKARIICTDRVYNSFVKSPIVALVFYENQETPVCYQPTGLLLASGDHNRLDLINAPEPEKDLGWVGITNTNRMTAPFVSREDACRWDHYKLVHHLVLRGGKIVDVTDEEK